MMTMSNNDVAQEGDVAAILNYSERSHTIYSHSLMTFTGSCEGIQNAYGQYGYTTKVKLAACS